MPGPDPTGIWYEVEPDGRLRVMGEVYPSSCPLWPGNPRSRLARMRAICRNVAFGGWRCTWCHDPVPIWRRADACFCSEGCRKRAARERRALREVCAGQTKGEK